MNNRIDNLRFVGREGRPKKMFPHNSLNTTLLVFTLSMFHCSLFCQSADRVEFFEDSDFKGGSFSLSGEARIFDLSAVYVEGQIMNFQDRISSVRLHGNTFLILFEDEGFLGNSIEIRENIANLANLRRGETDFYSWKKPNWNDSASSLQVVTRSNVALYENENYYGERIELKPGDAIPDLSKLRLEFGGTWNDEISSVTVSPGTLVLLYEHENFRGQVIEIRVDAKSLDPVRSSRGQVANWNENASSVRVLSAPPVDPDFVPGDVEPPAKPVSITEIQAPVTPPLDGKPIVATAYEHEHFNGRSVALTVGQKIRNLRPFDLQDSISSIKIDYRYSVILYEHEAFKGKSITLTGSLNDLGKVRRKSGRIENWSDTASSLVVKKMK